MFQRIHDVMHTTAPPWLTDTYTVGDAPDDPITIFYRDPVKAALHLAGLPTFSESSEYTPRKVFVKISRGVLERAYHEMTTGRLWNKLGVRN